MNEQRGSWLSLVMLCAVAALSTALGFGILFAGASAVFAGQSPALSNENTSEVPSQDSLPSKQEAEDNGAASGKTFAGMITDARCGGRHSRNSDKTSAECARSCVRRGSRYVLVDGEEVHGLDGDRTQLDRLAGMRVEVVGKLVGDTIKIESITAH